jgi:cell division protein FtsI/penicillin-binding protein 2
MVDTGFMRRVALVSLAIAVIFAMLGGRIFVLQTYGYEKYREKVIEQLTTKSPSIANRGEIYDSCGRLLATNKTTYRVFVSPSAISSAQRALDRKETASLSEKISKGLSEILGMSYEKIFEKTQKSRRLDETIAENIDEAQASLIRKFIIDERLEQLLFLELLVYFLQHVLLLGCGNAQKHRSASPAADFLNDFLRVYHNFFSFLCALWLTQ